MAEMSRSATLDDLKRLARSLDEQGAPYLLIGGYALAVHGYVRATIDIDLLVPGNVAAGERVCRALLVLPDGAARDIDPTWFTEGENIRVGDEITVDLMLKVNGQTYEQLAPYAQTIELNGVLIRTVSLEGLSLTKRTMRDKDRADLAVIERALAELRDNPDER